MYSRETLNAKLKFSDLSYLLRRSGYHGHSICMFLDIIRHADQSVTSALYFADIKNMYPSSSHYTRNWDKLVGEIKEEEKNEKLEGDAALNKLFQQIYSDGSDEVKRAMNKSFVRI